MVVLGSVGILLISYKGYGLLDDIISTVAGVFGIGVCLFPMECPYYPIATVGAFNITSTISNPIHCVCAGIFFGALSFMSFFLFTKTSGEMTKQKKIKNIIYRVCGIGLITSFSLFLLVFTPLFLLDFIPGFHFSAAMP